MGALSYGAGYGIQLGDWINSLITEAVLTQGFEESSAWL